MKEFPIFTKRIVIKKQTDYQTHYSIGAIFLKIVPENFKRLK